MNFGVELNSGHSKIGTGSLVHLSLVHPPWLGGARQCGAAKMSSWCSNIFKHNIPKNVWVPSSPLSRNPFDQVSKKSNHCRKRYQPTRSLFTGKTYGSRHALALGTRQPIFPRPCSSLQGTQPFSCYIHVILDGTASHRFTNGFDSHQFL